MKNRMRNIVQKKVRIYTLHVRRLATFWAVIPMKIMSTIFATNNGMFLHKLFKIGCKCLKINFILRGPIFYLN
jgi:hypothetical protein